MKLIIFFCLVVISYGELVPLWRYDGSGDQVYLSIGETVPDGYSPSGVLLGHVETTQVPGTEPLYEWFLNGYFYTTTTCTSDLSIGHTYEGETGAYCYQNDDPNRSFLPLYRLYSSVGDTYTYTTSDTERDMFELNGFVSQGTECYLVQVTNSPTQTPTPEPTPAPTPEPTPRPTTSPLDSFFVTATRIDINNPRQECHSSVSSFKKGVRCCYENSNGNTKCTAKNSAGNCYTDVQTQSKHNFFYDWFAANDICQTDEKRLCTETEYFSLCFNTGCWVDFSEGWTSTPCDPIYPTYQFNPEVESTQGPLELGGIRCCTLEEDASVTITDSKCVAKSDGSNDPPGETVNPLCFWAEEGFAANDRVQFTYTQATEICERWGYRLCELNVLKTRYDEIADTEDDHDGVSCSSTGCRQY